MRSLSEDGFTLFELLMVLLVLAMAAAVVVVNIGAGIDRTEAREESARLFRALRHARDLAVMNRTPSEVEIVGGGTSFVIRQKGSTVLSSERTPDGLHLGVGPVEFSRKSGATFPAWSGCSQ